MKGGLREGGRERARGGREEAMTLGRQRASVDEGRVEREREGGREGGSKGREGGSHDTRQAESVCG